MKYKTGDTVLIRSDLRAGAFHDGLCRSPGKHDCLSGSVRVIRAPYDVGGWYEIEGGWVLPSSLIDHVVIPSPLRQPLVSSVKKRTAAVSVSGAAFDFSPLEGDEDRIVITCKDQKLTTATLFHNGKEVGTASTKRSPSDDYSFATGAKLAFDRLMEGAPAQESKPKLYNGKVLPLKGDGVSITANKVYKVTDGYLADNYGDLRPNFLAEGNNSPLTSFDDLRRRMGGFKWVEVTDEQPEPASYYTGRVLCTSAPKGCGFTIGRIYPIVGGRLTNDHGAHVSNRVRDFANLKECVSPWYSFVEVKA